jgi:hypothetical protein
MNDRPRLRPDDDVRDRAHAVGWTDLLLQDARNWISVAHDKHRAGDAPAALHATHAAIGHANEAVEYLTELLVWSDDDE